MELMSEIDIFSFSVSDNAEGVNRILASGTNPNEQDSFGRTALHICSTCGSSETAAVLLKWKADTTIQDYENGWTPLHRSLYFGHLKITMLLLKAGAKLGDEFTTENSSIDIESKWERERTIRNSRSWRSPIDHDGHAPLDLLSLQLSPFLIKALPTYNHSSLACTEVLAFGKSDFFLGIPLPRAAVDVTRPRPVSELTLDVPIVDVVASKFHSAALTAGGEIFTWGIGKGGRLGHGDETTQPLPSVVRTLPGDA
jgi:inhibitor of Bruton tyrosine kinase